MKIQRPYHKKKNKTIIILILFCIIIISVITVALVIKHHSTTTQYQPKYTVSSNDTTTGDETSSSETSTKDSADTDATTSNVTSQEVPAATSGTVTIDDLEQKDGYVNVKATVSNFKTTQCVYSFTAQDAKPVIRQINGPCTGVSIPQGEFELIGTYTLTVTAYNGTSEKISATKDINVK